MSTTGVGPPGGSLDAAGILDALESVSRTIPDAITVTDLEARIVIWNPAAERLFGIPATIAVGSVIYDLTDSSIVGGAFPAGLGPAIDPRIVTLGTGSWTGRRIERVRVGPTAGREVVVEAALSRLDAPDGSPIGVLSVKRDVTGSVRLEQEFAALGTLATATGVARTRAEVAESALGLLVASTGATVGVIVRHVEDRAEIEAERGLDTRLRELIRSTPLVASPMVQALRAPGSSIIGRVAAIPLRDETRRIFLASGVESFAAVGLYRAGTIVGTVALGWDSASGQLPSQAALLQAAAHIEHAFENLRLLDRIVEQAQADRRLAGRLRALDELTSLGQAMVPAETLAERSARLVKLAIGARGIAYGLIDPVAAPEAPYSVALVLDLPDALAARMDGRSAMERMLFDRWRAGGGSMLASCETDGVDDEIARMALEAGLRSFAAIPIRFAGELAGGIVAFFDQPVEAVPVDQPGLDTIERTIGISLTNHRLRENLMASERRYRTLFDESPEAILVQAWTGEIVDANAAALRTFRADRDWLVSKHGEAVIGLDPEALRRAHAARGPRPAALRSTGTAADGTSFPIEVELAPVEIDGTSRVLILVRDLSTQAELQAELIQAQKMEAIGQLVSGVAHELNNPLAAIIAFAQLIRRDPDLPADLRRDADVLNQEADRTRRIVQNLLDFARQRPPERHPTRLDALVRTVLELQAYSLSTGRIEVVVDIPTTLPPVPLDRAQLQQVLLNLTRNAIQAIATVRDTGRITIEASEHTADGAAGRRMVSLSITDDGPGVMPEHRDRLFLPFFTTKPPGEGTGLGLPVSFGIVAAHRGQLRYEPAPGGRGARFVVELPVEVDEAWPTVVELPASTAAIAPGAAPAGSERPATTGARVLVLDDEPSIRRLLAKILHAAGHEAVPAADGFEAIELVRRGAVDAVVCDHRMAGMSGIEVYEKIVEIRPDLALRFAFMSGDVLNPELRAFAHDRGVGLLAKPFDVEAAVMAVTGLLATDRAPAID